MSQQKRAASPPDAPLPLDPMPDEARTLVFDAAQFGDDAAMLRGNPAMREAMQRLRRNVFRLFKAAPSTDAEALMRARVAWELLDEFDAALGQIVTDGQAAKAHQLRNAG